MTCFAFFPLLQRIKRITFKEDKVPPINKGGDCMSDDKKSERSESSDQKVTESCCYIVDPCCSRVVDPCGCYVDPCGCYVDPCCC